MALTLVKILVDLTIPGTTNPESPNPPGEGPTRPRAELDKIIRDGCGAVCTYSLSHQGPHFLVDLEEV